MTGKGKGIGAALLFTFAAAVSAQADTITFTMSEVFSGTGTPTGSPVATLDDMGATGSVLFTLDLTGLGGSFEKVGRWYFNTSVDIAGFTLTGFTVLMGDVTAPTTSYSFDNTTRAFKADGDGYFDLILRFGTPEPFGAGDKVSFFLNFPGITVHTFDVFSLSGPGSKAGPFKSAVHLRGVGGQGKESLWLAPGDGCRAVPEPGLALLALLGLAGALARRRR